MSGSDRPIFRASAVQAYRRRSEKDVVPRLVPTPVVVCGWLLVATLLGAAVVAWSVRVPTYVGGSGVVTGDRVAVLFVAPDESAAVRSGRPVRARVGSSAAYVRGAVATVARRAIGPDAVRRRYHLSGVLEQPAVAVTVRLAAALPPRRYAGSRLTAQVETGSERLLGTIFGGG